MRYILLLLVLTGCSASWHLKKAKKHQLLAVSKGAKVSNDTVYITKTFEVLVPGERDTVYLKPGIDVDAFDNTMALNDSLVIQINTATEDLKKGDVIDREKHLAIISRARKEIVELRLRLAQGYSKDSVYTVQPDSVTTITVEVKNGLLSEIRYVQKERKVAIQQQIPLWIEQAIKSGYTKWHLIIGGIFVLLLGFIVGFIAKTTSD